MAPNGINCPAISAGGNLPQTISFCRGLTSFANFRFFSALICFRYMKGVPKDTFLENLIGQADTFCLRGAGQRVRQDADQPGGKEIRAERTTPCCMQPMAQLRATIRKQR